MQIIPVIDLMAGQVVRGMAGRRSEYRPIVSRLVEGSHPVDVARTFVAYGLATIYLADLDAIGGAAPAWATYRQLLAKGAKLLVDAGVHSVASAAMLAEFAADGRVFEGIVVGLETVASPVALAEIARAIGGERTIFSLDLRGGELLTAADGWRGYDPLACAQAAIQAGVRRIIVLDLAAVGTNCGVSTLELCRELRGRHPALEIISGGGVRGPDDLVAMHAAGCNAALVASALHDGHLPLKPQVSILKPASTAAQEDRGG